VSINGGLFHEPLLISLKRFNYIDCTKLQLVWNYMCYISNDVLCDDPKWLKLFKPRNLSFVNAESTYETVCLSIMKKLLIHGLKGLSYKRRLERLKLPGLKYRRQRGDTQPQVWNKTQCVSCQCHYALELPSSKLQTKAAYGWTLWLDLKLIHTLIILSALLLILICLSLTPASGPLSGF